MTQSSVLARALVLLEAFDNAHPVLKLSELAVHTGLPQTTVYRHVVDLVQWGALDRAVSGGAPTGSCRSISIRRAGGTSVDRRAHPDPSDPSMTAAACHRVQ